MPTPQSGASTSLSAGMWSRASVTLDFTWRMSYFLLLSSGVTSSTVSTVVLAMVTVPSTT